MFYRVNQGFVPNWLWQSIDQNGYPTGMNKLSLTRMYRPISGRPLGARPTGFDVLNDISRRLDFLAKSVDEALQLKEEKELKSFPILYM